VIPLDLRPGSYKLLTIVDPDSAVRESNESNNLTVGSITVR
jgi:subtilase family serine protease